MGGEPSVPLPLLTRKVFEMSATIPSVYIVCAEGESIEEAIAKAQPIPSYCKVFVISQSSAADNVKSAAYWCEWALKNVRGAGNLAPSLYNAYKALQTMGKQLEDNTTSMHSEKILIEKH